MVPKYSFTELLAWLETFSLVIIAAQGVEVQRKEQGCMLCVFMIHVWHWCSVFFEAKYCFAVLAVHKPSRAVVMWTVIFHCCQCYYTHIFAVADIFFKKMDFSEVKRGFFSYFVPFTGCDLHCGLQAWNMLWKSSFIVAGYYDWLMTVSYKFLQFLCFMLSLIQ